MKYDDASWHSDSVSSASSPEEYSGTHIALYLKWCFIKGWAGDLHMDEEPEDVRKVIEGSLSATEFLFKYCDGKFHDEYLTSKGNEFSEKYYGDKGFYLDDYSSHFKDHMYVMSEDEHDFVKFSNIVDSRYKSGNLSKKPWWKIW